MFNSSTCYSSVSEITTPKYITSVIMEFIQNVLPSMILERNEDLRSKSIVKCTAEASLQLDGFMSAIFSVELVLKDENGV